MNHFLKILRSVWFVVLTIITGLVVSFLGVEIHLFSVYFLPLRFSFFGSQINSSVFPPTDTWVLTILIVVFFVPILINKMNKYKLVALVAIFILSVMFFHSSLFSELSYNYETIQSVFNTMITNLGRLLM